MKPLTNETRRVAAEAARRRLTHELDEVEQLAALNPGRLAVLGVHEAGGQILALAVGFRIRTSVAPDRGTAAPGRRVEEVRAEVLLAGYPDATPRVCLSCGSPLFLPGVAVVGSPDGRFAGFPCLYRGEWDATTMHVPFLVRQIHAALIGDPAVLNAPADCLNRRAATYFLDHRDELPLDTPLADVPNRQPPAPRRRFEVEVR